jgi:hypothetical protein
MKRLTQLAILAVCAACALPAQNTQPGAPTDQDLNIRAYIELLRSDVNKEKSQVMAEVMALDADQSAKFWPVYRNYQTALSKIGDGVARLIKDYADNFDNMTDAAADSLANRLFTLEQEREVIKKQYYERVKAAIGGVHALRFLQVENQLERLVDLQISSSLPVVKRGSGQ